MKTNHIYQGDALSILKILPDESINCVVTSPPYWGLRCYGIEPMVWDADDDCLHDWGDEITRSAVTGGTNQGNKIDNNNGCTYIPVPKSNSSYCIKCGAWRGSLGLEPTPELFVKHIVNVFRDVKRVLKKDGTLWLNLGDSYTNNSIPGNGDPTIKNRNIGESNYSATIIKGLKPKNLIGIPWRVAFALQADGWYLRSDIIWHKPNPMPESVKDRPTKAHEYLFLLSKSSKYYYDGDAIKEKSIDPESYMGRRPRNAPQIYYNDFDNCSYTGSVKNGKLPHGQKYELRNKRSVWTVATENFNGAHFATFPTKLIVDCIKAGCPEDDIVLDPFFGSGTTGEVALRLNRKFIGIELNPDYIKIANKRLKPFIGDLFNGII